MNIYEVPTFDIESDDFDINTLTFPYNDNKMTYNSITHMYTLTAEAFKQDGIILEEEIDSSNPERSSIFLKENSRLIYNYVQKASQRDSAVLEGVLVPNYMISKSFGFTDDELYYREEFKTAMIEQGKFTLNNGDIRDNSGVNLNNSIWINKNVLRNDDRHMSPISIEILRKLGLLFNNYKVKDIFDKLEW